MKTSISAVILLVIFVIAIDIGFAFAESNGAAESLPTSNGKVRAIRSPQYYDPYNDPYYYRRRYAPNAVVVPIVLVGGRPGFGPPPPPFGFGPRGPPPPPPPPPVGFGPGYGPGFGPNFGLFP